MKIYFLEKSKYDVWRDSVSYSSYEDPKGYEGVSYSDMSNLSKGYPNTIISAEVKEDENSEDIIQRIIGEKVNHFQAEQIRKHIAESHEKFRVDINELIQESLHEISGHPNVSLMKISSSSGFPRFAAIPSKNTMEDASVADGDILFVERYRIADLIENIAKRIYMRHVAFSALFMRNADHFIKSVRPIENGKSVSSRPMSQYLDDEWENDRPQVCLLYTEEDIHVASYIRTHFDSLDKASGDLCDVLMIENPNAVDPALFWRKMLDEVTFVIWRSLGWETSKPYDKSDAYELAKHFSIDMDMLPCAFILPNGPLRQAENLVKLEGDLTSVFRGIFSGFQKSNTSSRSFFRSGERNLGNEKQEPFHERPTCFLSHNIKDKPIVRTVASSLHTLGIDTWFDEWEILPGDSIVGKIEEGLRNASHLAVFLSKSATGSNWVKEEMNAALHRAISSQKIKIIPIILEECEIPILIESYAMICDDQPGSIANEIARSVFGSSQKPPVIERI